MKTFTFHVNGMHCKACVVLTESELSEVPEVSKVKASLEHLSIEVTGDFGDKSAEHVAGDLSEVLKPHGYTLSLEKQKHLVQWSDFSIAIPIAGAFIALFIILQKLGIVNLVTASNVSYGTAFIIGAIASVSTCMAVVGGLVLSMSANFAKEGDKVRPQVLFHIGRLVSFFLPCGFTQSMQIYTLTTGNFLTGAMTMFVFALGTLPVLAILSFSSLSIHKKAQSGIFFKSAGLVVIFFGIFNLINSLVGIGFIPPIFSF